MARKRRQGHPARVHAARTRTPAPHAAGSPPADDSSYADVRGETIALASTILDELRDRLVVQLDERDNLAVEMAVLKAVTTAMCKGFADCGAMANGQWRAARAELRRYLPASVTLPETFVTPTVDLDLVDGWDETYGPGSEAAD